MDPIRALKSFAGETSRVRDWLLDSGAQIGAGPESGAVAGWLDDRGAPAFAYPEATGYFLTWLAFAAARGWAYLELSERARRAIAWIERAFGRPDPPPTRIFSDPSVDDWRNQARFSFDLAMLARGISCARVLTGTDRALDRVAAALEPFAGAAGLAPVSMAAAPLPVRWSTVAGSHLTKAAAAILRLPPDRVSPELRAAADRTYGAWRAYTPRIRAEGHAVLYGAEGLFLEGIRRGDDSALRRAASTFLRVSETAANGRPDVAAQALRLGCALADRGVLDHARCSGRLERLASAVRRTVSSSGSIVFFSEAANQRHHNVWAAMFAHQALAFHDALEGGLRLPPRWLELLV